MEARVVQYIGVSENPAVLRRVRDWLTETYGGSVSRCVASREDVASLCAMSSNVCAIITDLPQGMLLHNWYDELTRIAKGARIIFLDSGASDIFVPPGKRDFTIVPMSRLEAGLSRVLHVR